MTQAHRFYFFKGRVALYSLLKAFGIGPGDRVLLPGYTCVVVPSAVRYLGAIPEYADIEVNSYNAQLTQYEQAYARLTRQDLAGSLKLVLIQHTYGNPTRDTQAIVSWARARGLRVIEDCAHCNGVMLDGREVGTFGDGAFFSLQWSKPVTTGVGGIALVNGPEFSDRLAQIESELIQPGWIETCVLAFQLLAHHWLLSPRMYWFALNTHRRLSRLGLFVGSSSVNELQGSMPPDYLKSMGRLQKWLLRRRSADTSSQNSYRVHLAEVYDRLLSAGGLGTFRRETGAVLIRYPLRSTNREECLRAAAEARIELGDWFDHPLHPAGSSLDGLNWDGTVCPHAVQVAGDVVNLPLGHRISEAEAKRVVDFISNWAARE